MENREREHSTLYGFMWPTRRLRSLSLARYLSNGNGMQTIKCESCRKWPLVDISPLGISWFEPSSMIKVVLYRGWNFDLFNQLVGQHEGQVVDLLENCEYNV